MSTKRNGQNGINQRMTMRLKAPLGDSLQKICAASRRTKTSIIEESLELILPALERKYLHRTA
jgi:predicted transcriptional regulator